MILVRLTLLLSEDELRALTPEEQNNEKEKVRAALLAAQAANRWWRGCKLFCGRMRDDHQHGGQAGAVQRTRGIYFLSPAHSAQRWSLMSH